MITYSKVQTIAIASDLNQKMQDISLQDFVELSPVWLTFALSFVFVALENLTRVTKTKEERDKRANYNNIELSRDTEEQLCIW